MRVNWQPSDLAASKAEELAERKSASQKALQEAAEQFEAIFLYQLMEQMRRTVPENDLLGDRRAEKIFQSMLDQEMAGNVAQGQSIGLAKMIYEQMSRYVPDDD
ncbi:MAG: flagellar biosynthesis protein FlgJ [Firmicutes bacterium]|nr:flagellar biosynthesis protein FlgJ [Bacillota bacterium]